LKGGADNADKAALSASMQSVQALQKKIAMTSESRPRWPFTWCRSSMASSNIWSGPVAIPKTVLSAP
jgi:hypothetical protein